MSTPTPNSNIILACDPGYDRLGVAIMGGSVHHPELLFSTCIMSEKTDAHHVRLAYLARELTTLIRKYTPSVLAVETLFFSANKKTALQVAESRGMLLTIAGTEDLALVEHSPQQIKLAVTGHGRTEKKEVIAMTKRLVKNAPEKALDDEYDAIALGLCAIASYRKRVS